MNFWMCWINVKQSGFDILSSKSSEADDASPDNHAQPLASRMRPRNLSEYIGQTHLLAKGKPLGEALRRGQLHSMILWGPPGTGKTRLARLGARLCDARYDSLSAVLSGVKEIRSAIDLAKEHQQQLGLVHGGVTATIADVAAGFAGFTLVGPDEHTVTAEFKCSYFRKGRGQLLRAVGRVVKPGRAFHFCEADVFCVDDNGNEELIARATTTMAVIQVTGDR